MATLSLAVDYTGDPKFNTVFSPIHATNRIPPGNDDFNRVACISSSV